MGLVLWYSEGGRGNWRGEDWRTAVATVDDRRAWSNAVVVAPWSANPAATYYGARASDVSTANSIWVLTLVRDGNSSWTRIAVASASETIGLSSGSSSDGE